MFESNIQFIKNLYIYFFKSSRIFY